MILSPHNNFTRWHYYFPLSRWQQRTEVKELAQVHRANIIEWDHDLPPATCGPCSESSAYLASGKRGHSEMDIREHLPGSVIAHHLGGLRSQQPAQRHLLAVLRLWPRRNPHWRPEVQSVFGTCVLLTKAIKVCLSMVHVPGPLVETRMALRPAAQDAPEPLLRTSLLPHCLQTTWKRLTGTFKTPSQKHTGKHTCMCMCAYAHTCMRTFNTTGYIWLLVPKYTSYFPASGLWLVLFPRQELSSFFLFPLTTTHSKRPVLSASLSGNMALPPHWKWIILLSDLPENTAHTSLLNGGLALCFLVSRLIPPTLGREDGAKFISIPSTTQPALWQVLSMEIVAA